MGAGCVVGVLQVLNRVPWIPQLLIKVNVDHLVNVSES